MSAPHSPNNQAKSRRGIGAALGLVLLAGAAPFLRPANAVDLPPMAAAAIETAVVTGAEAVDPAIWVNPTDATQSMILGTYGDRLVTHDMSGAVVAQSGVAAPGAAEDVTGVDVRPAVTAGTQLMGDVATVVGNKIIRFYTIDPATRQLTDVTIKPEGINPQDLGRPRSASNVCMYTSPVSGKTFAFIMADNGQMAQLELINNSGKIDVTMVRGGQNDATAWDASTVAVSGCVVDDERRTLYVSERDGGILKFGAEPTDPTTGEMIDTPAPGNLLAHVKGLTIVDTGEQEGWLIASTLNDPAEAVNHSFNVYNRADGAYVRTFQVDGGPATDRCELTDGLAASAGNFGGQFTEGLLVCQDKKNRNGVSGGGFVEHNFKMVPLHLAADMTPVTTTTTTVPPTTTTTTAPIEVPQGGGKSGYWMVGSDGKVYAFGDARTHGDAVLPAGAQAVDLEPTPSGNGYWLLDDFGHVFPKGDAKAYGDVDRSLLTTAETITSLSSTKTGNGYWIFTSAGRAIPFGDANHHGDMSKTKLNGPVLDSITTPSGDGYYMVGSDGGIFSFGDAKFYGSMGDRKLNKPVQSLVPDSDGVGYWLVASDGGIFAFDARFKGSMGDQKLNKPVTGMVRYGDGYLMVGEDGGIFNFSNKEFAGSLGATPPQKPITSVAALELAAR